MLTFDDPISKLPRITPTQTRKLHNLGIYSIKGLVYHFPFRYDDYSIKKEISQLYEGETVTIKGVVERLDRKKVFRRRMVITNAYIKDQTGSVKAVWFNVFGPLRYLNEGKYVQISGTLRKDKKGELHFQHPNFEIISKKQFESEESSHQGNTTATGALVPIYPETRGMTSYWLRATINKILVKVKFEEFLPKDIIKSQKIPELREAMRSIHFPKSAQQAKLAKERFAFEKLFLIQIKALLVRQEWENNKATPVPFDQKKITKFVKSLPFSLTDAQKKTAWQIIKDLEKTKPMNRLLEGDVGSGKTVVAAIAALSTIMANKQVVILAPTEVLAIQHYSSILNLFSKNNLVVALLTSSHSKKNNRKIKKETLLSSIKKGNIDIIIGTHALLQNNVIFKHLSLVIIDEQHRFGVKQRAHLQSNTLSLSDGDVKNIPHLLTMTATPIPRTLSLAIFGNLDLSIIDEYPKGRKEIITRVIPPIGRKQVYSFISKQVTSGRQVFVIYPLVTETSKISEVKAATEEHKLLQEKIFPNLKIGLLHGKMKSKEKEVVMNDFKKKKLDILVATSVVEVGVDVPNATIMVIEGAERFGLAQLHQFRGRVGRDRHQSYCFLLTSDNVPGVTRRLKTMEKTNDGFKIAQADLKLRGPGQFMGTMQSGIPDIAMESLSDMRIIESARVEAQRIIAFDPKLKNFPLLAENLSQLETVTHWE